MNFVLPTAVRQADLHREKVVVVAGPNPEREADLFEIVDAIDPRMIASWSNDPRQEQACQDEQDSETDQQFDDVESPLPLPLLCVDPCRVHAQRMQCIPCAAGAAASTPPHSAWECVILTHCRANCARRTGLSWFL
jgi:hypothetical protein